MRRSAVLVAGWRLIGAPVREGFPNVRHYQPDAGRHEFPPPEEPEDEEPIFAGTGDKKKPVGITLHNPGSEAFEAADAKRTNRSLVRSKRKIDLNADLLRADQIDFLSRVTVSFDNLAYPPAGAATGEELFKALYSDRKFGWAVAQVNAHLADWGNALKSSVAA